MLKLLSAQNERTLQLKLLYMKTDGGPIKLDVVLSCYSFKGVVEKSDDSPAAV